MQCIPFISYVWQNHKGHRPASSTWERTTSESSRMLRARWFVSSAFLVAVNLLALVDHCVKRSLIGCNLTRRRRKRNSRKTLQYRLRGGSSRSVEWKITRMLLREMLDIILAFSHRVSYACFAEQNVIHIGARENCIVCYEELWETE